MRRDGFQFLGHLGRHTHAVDALAFTPSGRWVASGSYDGIVRLWNVQALEVGAVLRAHTGRVFSRVQPGRNVARFGPREGTIKLWPT